MRTERAQSGHALSRVVITDDPRRNRALPLRPAQPTQGRITTFLPAIFGLPFFMQETGIRILRQSGSAVVSQLCQCRDKQTSTRRLFVLSIAGLCICSNHIDVEIVPWCGSSLGEKRGNEHGSIAG